MTEIIMCYQGKDEDSHNLKRVGELVRCKNCRYYNSKDFNCNDRANFGRYWRPNDYCSFGVKNDD